MRSFDSKLADLEGAIRHRRGHAYLIEASPAEMPDVLRAVRRALLCAHPPDATCRACADAPHPDWTEVGIGGGRTIGRAEVADWPERALVPPLMAPVRVFVVRDADRLTPDAANLLLKLVEEPPDPVVVILTTDGVHDVLPTLRSRCRWVAFRDPEATGLSSPREPDWSASDWPDALASVAEGIRSRIRTSPDVAEVRRLVGDLEAVVAAALDLEQNANREIVRRRLEFRFGRI